MTRDAGARLYLSDLSEGDTFVTNTTAVDAEQIIAFARQYDPQPFHLDAEAAQATFFRGLAASGWQTASITMELLVTSGLPLADGLVGAGAELAWPTPTRPGDVLHVEVRIVGIARSASRPDRGFVTVRSETLTASGEVRQVMSAKLLVFDRK